MRRQFAVTCGTGLMLVVAAMLLGAAPSAVSGTVDLALRVVADTALEDLHATPEQLTRLRDLASDTTSPIVLADAKDIDDAAAKEPAFQKLLVEVRDALDAGDHKKMTAAREQLNELENKYDVDFSPGIELTPAARKKAMEAIQLFTSAQITDYIDGRSDDVPDPLETILDGIDQSQAMVQAEFPAFRTEVAEEMATLVAGVDLSKSRPVFRQVGDLLTKAHRLTPAEFAAQRSQLEQTARGIASSVTEPVAVRHWMEGEIADLLGNPQLQNAINARLAREPAGK